MKPKLKKQNKVLTIRLSETDLKMIKNAAAAKQRPISLWVREACRTAAMAR